MAFSYEQGAHVEVWAQYLARKLVELDVGRVFEGRHDDRGQPSRLSRYLALSLSAALWGTNPVCKVTPVILHGVVSGVTLHGVVSPEVPCTKTR